VASPAEKVADVIVPGETFKCLTLSLPISVSANTAAPRYLRRHMGHSLFWSDACPYTPTSGAEQAPADRSSPCPPLLIAGHKATKRFQVELFLSGLYPKIRPAAGPRMVRRDVAESGPHRKTTARPYIQFRGRRLAGRTVSRNALWCPTGSAATNPHAGDIDRGATAVHSNSVSAHLPRRCANKGCGSPAFWRIDSITLGFPRSRLMSPD